MVLNWLSSKIGGNFNNNKQEQDQQQEQKQYRQGIQSQEYQEEDYNHNSYNQNIGESYDNILNDKERGLFSNSSRNGRLRATECLSSKAREMLDTALEPFVRTNDGCIVDHMVNLFGIGEETNCYANKEIRDRFSHPIKFLKFKAFTSACAINDISQWDRQYVVRLTQLLRELKSNYPVGKSILSSLDKRYDENGVELLNETGLYIPNDYLMDIIHDFPDLFVPCISIHPYRKDSIDELLKWIVKGVRYVRWMPVSMGIDPSSPLCDNFYEALVENDIILFVHTGVEHSLVEPPESDSHLGNPLLLRRPLDKGVKIVAVHCGGEGKSYDYDDESKQIPPIIPNLHLFLRLMHEPKYEHLLIGDLSGIVAYHRVDALVPLLDHQHIHHRLIFSSDYPIPAVNLAVITTLLANRGLITPDERDLVNEIYRFNPILFDFVLKRILRSPITNNSFQVSIFKENPFFYDGNDFKNKLMGTPSSTSSMVFSPIFNGAQTDKNHNNNINHINNNFNTTNHNVISHTTSTTTTTTTTTNSFIINNTLNSSSNSSSGNNSTNSSTFIQRDNIDIFSPSSPPHPIISPSFNPNQSQYQTSTNTNNLLDDFTFNTTMIPSPSHPSQSTTTLSSSSSSVLQPQQHQGGILLPSQPFLTIDGDDDDDDDVMEEYTDF